MAALEELAPEALITHSNNSHCWLEIKNIRLHFTIQNCFTLLIRKPISAVTVTLAVMKAFQKLINAVPVMPVKMYQTISKHIMFRCHCWFLWLISLLGICWLMLE